jgi:transposase
MKKTAMGFQAVNGTSHLRVGDNANSGIFIEFLCELKVLNSENEKTKNILEELSSQENIQDEYIQETISQRSKKSFIDKLQDKINNNNLSKDELSEKLQSELDKENSKDKRKISKIKAENFALNFIKKFNIDLDKKTITNYAKLKDFAKNEELMDEKIGNYFPDEKRIVIVLDNSSVHIAYLIRIIAKILNIKLIFLPSYSPNLNPIENVWRTLKNELYSKYIESEEFLTERFTKIYYKIIDRPSFTKKWKEDYIAKK